MSKKAFIFDLDGVIVDTAKYHFLAWQKLAQELRIMGMTQPAEVNYQNRRAWGYDVDKEGYRYHLANVHAALGSAQLKKIKLDKKDEPVESPYNDAI